jgi:hypothetical protein
MKNIQTRTQQRETQLIPDFKQTKAFFLFVNMHRSRIKHQNPFIIIKKLGFDQNGFRFKTETLGLKPLKTC